MENTDLAGQLYCVLIKYTQMNIWACTYPGVKRGMKIRQTRGQKELDSLALWVETCVYKPDVIIGKLIWLQTIKENIREMLRKYRWLISDMLES